MRFLVRKKRWWWIGERVRWLGVGDGGDDRQRCSEMRLGFW